jgi:RNA polymerase-binding protein DksA
MAQHDQDEAAVRERLEAERFRIKQEIYRQTQGDETVPPTDPLLDTGGQSTDSADDADALADHERTQMLISNAQAMLEQIDTALARLSGGTYGICTNCGAQIAPRRLESLPYATLCIACQSAAEDARARRRT